ncbi:MAG TPA: TIGR02679 family protein [Trebonia sp.]|nr:TIGR02679 family protein [Trebonia sp.]
MTSRPFDGPEYRRLLDAARRSLERTGGSLDGSISIAAPSDAERKAVIGITGTYREGGASRLTARLSDLDAAVAEATGSGLADLLAAIFGGPLRDRPAERERLAAGVDKCARLLSDSYLASCDWYSSWVAGLRADGTLTRLVNASDIGPVLQAVNVLEAMDGRDAPVLLQALAAEVTGDTKALSHPAPLSSLVLRALALRLGLPRPLSAEDRRDLWDEFDVVVDDLASRVLVLGLPAVGEGLGDWLTSAARRGMPFYVTLQQLVSMPLSVGEPVVYVCENPAVLRAAAGSLGSLSLPLVCTEGRPSTAFHRLASAVVAGRGELRYHGDFDWPGISIAASVMSRHGATAWRLGSADYLAGVRACATSGESVPLSGAPLQTPWDPSLSPAMAQAGQVIYEESVIDALLADLQG